MMDRGVSVTVSYALSLAVATLLLSALMMASGTMIENRQQEVYRSELRVIGQDLVANLMAVDRLASTGATEVRIDVSTPRRIGGTGYEIDVRTDAGEAELVLRTHDPIIAVTIPIQNSTAIAESTVDGGTLRIHYSAGGSIEVTA